MKTRTKKLRSPLKWHGGKGYLARRIADLMPRHVVYNEPYAGGLNVLLNKPKAPVEFTSDLNPGLVLFWQVLADYDDTYGCRFGNMHKRACFNKYSRETFALAKNFIEHPPWPLDQIDRAEYAAFFLMWNRMSRGGLGKDFAWSDRLRGGQPGDVNAWKTCIQELTRVNERMRSVAVWCKPALEAIRDTDSADTLHYLDPPYLHETRTVKKAYEYEMTYEQHQELLGTLQKCRGIVMLSGYRSALYDLALLDWTRHEFDMPNHAGQGKTKNRRTECLWINRQPHPPHPDTRQAMKNSDGTDSRWLNVREVADLLGLDRTTVYKQADEGTIPGYRFGGARRFDRGEIEQHIKKCAGAGPTGKFQIFKHLNL